MKTPFLTALLSATTALYALAAMPTYAASFTIMNGQTVAGQTIGAGASQTGTVDAGGTIATTGINNSAITSTSVGGTITNNGTLTTTGDSAIGIYINSVSNNTATSSGSITTTGDSAHGIYSLSGNNSTLTNNRSITTSGATAGGMLAVFGSTHTLTNNGTITASGDDSNGMQCNVCTDSTMINNGTITTSGDNVSFGGVGPYGMVVSGTNSSIVNNGRVIDTYKGVALRIQGTSGTITNQGYAKSFGSDTVQLHADDSTLIIKAGSMVDGTVLFDGSGARILQYDVSGTRRGGSVLAITGAITGAPTTSIINSSSIPSGARVVQGGNTVAVVTPDQFASSQQIISQIVYNAGNVVNNRQQLALLGDTTEANSGTQYAASNHSMNDGTNPNAWAVRDRNVAWAEAFGSYQERGGSSDTSNSTARSGGVLAGIDFPQTSEGVRAGLYAGGFSGNLDVGSLRTIDSAGGMAGGTIGKSFGGYYVSGGLGLGFSNNDSHRFTSIDTASADYTSYFISPSVTVMRPVKGSGVTWVPNATLRYTAQHDGSYTESGSVANQSVDSRISHVLDARAMLEARMDEKRFQNGGTLKPSFRAGIRGKTLLGGNKTDVSVLGNNLSFDPKGDDHTIDGVFGSNLDYSVNDRLNLYVDGEANLGLNNGGAGNNKGIVGRIGAKWKL